MVVVLRFEEALAQTPMAMDFAHLEPFTRRPCLITLLEAIPETISPRLHYAHLIPKQLAYAPWIRARALEMERMTGSVINALELLEIAGYEAVDGGQLRGLLLAYDALLNALPRPEAISLTLGQFEALQESGVIPSAWSKDLAQRLLLDERLDLSSVALSALYNKMAE